MKKKIKKYLFALLYLLIFYILCVLKVTYYLPSFSIFVSHDIHNNIFKHSCILSELKSTNLDSIFNANNNCSFCIFTVRNRHIPNSSPKDVIMSSMFSKSFNLIPSLRSLRTTGSKCGVIIFTDSKLYHQINEALFTFLKNCGCLMVNAGELLTSTKKKLFMARNLVIYEFLKLNYLYLSRIIIIDLYDTIFQGDPFNDYFLNDTIGLSLETTKIQGDHIKGISILFGQKKANQLCLKRKIINCGTIIGTSHVVLKFLDLFIETANKLSDTDYKELVDTGFPDQSIVNALVCGQILDEHGIKYHLYTVHEDYVSLHKIYRNKTLNLTLGNFIYDSSYYPLLVHLFDRSKMFCQSVLNACPQTFDIPFEYIRCMNIYR